ncbi:MAG: PBP1A family penicillin-binding protein, partial [Gemmatimonadetes bacterium]|nr:PBP1A family penicillin-binding protein [Gemmatimonadota bacterium]
AFLAVEDRRFYQHHGVDWKRFMGALVKNVKARGVAEGGSTITMQLARNLFPKALPYQERSIRRKLMEIRVARQIEQALPKDKILELYMNHIYLGEGAYGVDAAAREYFGKPASQLSIGEAAVLGGLPKAPSQINPREDRKAATERRDLVLEEMAKAGYITPAQAAEAKAKPIRLARNTAGARAERGAYFKAQVRRELDERVGDQFYTSGLRVYTSYDPVAQTAAEEELARQIGAIEAGRFGSYRHPTYAATRGDTAESGNTTYLQGAVILMDARNGEVRALVGGRDYDDSKFDRATQAQRQPGSAFKPFVYLTALERGIAPSQKFEDAPLKVTLTGGQTWEPKNYTPNYAGPITLREALTQSKNTVTVRVAQEVGMDDVIRTAHELGISNEISSLPSTSLGAAEVRPMEMTEAYAAFANGGERVEPHFIRRIEDRDGGVVWEAEEERESVIEPAAAFVLTSMLQDVVARGTGTMVRAVGFGGPAAGKTGTTNAATDVWFIGYTPELVGTVWIGLDKPETIVPGASGGTLAAPVWGRIMSRVYAGRPMPRPWSPPSGVATAQVDRVTGIPVDAACPARGPTYTEYFIGSPPAGEGCYPGANAPYGAVATTGVDTAWHDTEWGAPADASADTSLAAAGIDWPELEAMRRHRATAGAAALPDTAGLPPLPTDGNLPMPRSSAPAAPRRRIPVARPASPPPTGDDGAPASPPAREETPRQPPKVLGTPTQGEPASPPAPAPSTPPDTTQKP